MLAWGVSLIVALAILAIGIIWVQQAWAAIVIVAVVSLGLRFAVRRFATAVAPVLSSADPLE